MAQKKIKTFVALTEEEIDILRKTLSSSQPEEQKNEPAKELAKKISNALKLSKKKTKKLKKLLASENI